MLERIMNGFRAFWGALKNGEKDRLSLSLEDRRALSSIAWEFHKDRAYSADNQEFWSAYFTFHKMYKLTRLLYNPVPLINGFYVNGLWRSDARVLDDGTPLLTPCLENTEENLLSAIAQLDQWGNAAKEFNKIKERVSATGSCLVEIIDDSDAKKVRHKTQSSNFVKDIALNDVDDVQSYVIEYETFDENKKAYRFTKIVDKETYSYFRDDKPFIPKGKNATVVEHNCGFCPAVWIQHSDDGSEAFTSYAKLNELNSFVSHALRHGHKAFESPKVLSTKGEIDYFIGGSTYKDKSGSNKSSYTPDASLEWVVLKTPEGASVLDLSGNLALMDAYPYAENLIKSIGDSYHELQYYSLIKEQSSVTGVALERMLAPAQNCLDRAASNYNPQLIKLRQMQIAIAGQRIKERSWTNLTDAQEKFRGFDLMSYEKGLLNFNLKRSLLVQLSESESEDLKKKKIDTANAAKGLVDNQEALKLAGYSADDITQILSRKKQEASTVPTIPAPVGESTAVN